MEVSGTDLKLLADKIRRQPELAQGMDVSQLVEGWTGRWRQYSDMLQASDEVPLAAWIVRRKAEGLVRPPLEEEDGEPFDPERRPAWLLESEERLNDLKREGDRYLSRPLQVLLTPSPPGVKEATLGKLAGSFPKVRKREEPPSRTIARPFQPFMDHVRDLLHRLAGKPRLVLQIEYQGAPQAEWVAAFLAAVHLWHGQALRLSQTEPFGLLVVERLKEKEAPRES